MICSPYLLGYRRHDSRRSDPRPSERLVMFLVTGATGTIGRPLLDVLVDEGAKVRAVTRDPQATNLPAEVEVVQGDLTRPATIAPFLDGVTALFLHPRAVGRAAGALLALAPPQGPAWGGAP